MIVYSGQNDDTIRLISEKYPRTLICLDSGTSFRNKIYSYYAPSNIALNLTTRPHNVEFITIQDLEAEDIKALFLIKNKIEEPSVSNKTLIRKILQGNPIKKIPTLMLPDDIDEYIRNMNGVEQTLKPALYIEATTSIPRYRIEMNEKLLTKELEIYRTNLDNFDEIYKRI